MTDQQIEQEIQMLKARITNLELRLAAKNGDKLAQEIEKEIEWLNKM